MSNLLDLFRKEKAKVVIDKELGTVGSGGILINRLLDGTQYNADDISIKIYRKMRLDPQISACLNVIKFTMQKIDWYIEGDSGAKSVAEESMKNVWNQLIRSTTKGLWAGYSPNVKVFTINKGKIILKKIRDLTPETCKVKTDKNGNFNGFIQQVNGRTEYISSQYAFWYANQMEDGDLYGNSMIKPAYKPWYYAELIHTFANRYYERFGEPVVLGRAPVGNILEDSSGNKIDALQQIQSTINNLRSHSSVSIPSDTDDSGNFIYDIKYLESQMRGVDFDVYMKRLDGEKARAIFVPDLLLGSGNVGSYALGLEHKATFITGIMGIIEDMFEYFNKYIIQQIVELNYPTQKAVLKYTPLSRVTEDAIMGIVKDMVSSGKISPEIQAMSDRIGIPLTKEVISPPIAKPIKEIAKKQLDRIRNYLSKSLLNDKKEAINNLKIGFPEAFNSELSYITLENEVKEKIRSCLSAGYSLEKIIKEVGITLGIEDREEARNILREEAKKILGEEDGYK